MGEGGRGQVAWIKFGGERHNFLINRTGNPEKKQKRKVRPACSASWDCAPVNLTQAIERKRSPESWGEQSKRSGGETENLRLEDLQVHLDGGSKFDSVSLEGAR